MRIAIIGHGVIGSMHRRILQTNGYDLVAVCDINEAKLTGLGDLPVYTDWQTMLDTERPDAVHICTPHHLHTEMILGALKRDIHALCEKPLCIHREDIPLILEAEAASKATLGVCLQNRYNEANLFAKQYLETHSPTSGWGLVSWNRDMSYYTSADWRGKWETEGGGVLINQALHTLDLMLWLLGEPTSVTASTCTIGHEGLEVEDVATALCHGERPFTFFATTCADKDMPVEISINCEGGIMRVMPKQVLVGGELHSFEESTSFASKGCYGEGHAKLFHHFYECIAGGKPFPIDGTEGAKVVKLITAIYESNGKVVNV